MTGNSNLKKGRWFECFLSCILSFVCTRLVRELALHVHFCNGKRIFDVSSGFSFFFLFQRIHSILNNEVDWVRVTAVAASFHRITFCFLLVRSIRTATVQNYYTRLAATATSTTDVCVCAFHTIWHVGLLFVCVCVVVVCVRYAILNSERRMRYHHLLQQPVFYHSDRNLRHGTKECPPALL